MPEGAEGRLEPPAALRGISLDLYQHGRWTDRYRDFISVDGSPLFLRAGTEQDLPLLSPDQYFLTFSLDLREVPWLFLADPVLFADDAGDPPVIGKRPTSLTPWFYRRDSTLVRRRDQSRDEYRYIQVTRQLGATELVPADPPDPSYEQRLLGQPVDGVRSWTKDLLGRLVERGQLSSRAWTTFDREHTDGLPPGRRMKVAIAHQ